MARKKTAREVIMEELSRTKNAPRWKYYGFVPPNDIEKVKKRIRMEGLSFRTEKVIHWSGAPGYNVYVR